MRARLWGLLGFHVALIGCSSSGSDGTLPPLLSGGYGGQSQGGAAGNGGNFPSGAGGGFVAGGFGGTVGSGGSSRGGSSGASGGGNAPSTGGEPAVNICGAVFKDCNNDPTDGCEADVQSDAKNCGSCGNVCPAAANATPTCFVGKCDFACQAHWGDCDSQPGNGCEDNLLTDQKDCGACKADCGQKACQNGGCECASTSVQATKVPLDIYVLFDQSGSMNENVTGGTKWAVIQGALTSFVQNPASTGISIGIGYFPFVVPGAPALCMADADCKVAAGDFGPCVGGLPVFGCNFFGLPACNCQKADACQSGTYTSDVGIALLPGVSGAIVTSLGNHGPGGGTPTYPALQGAYKYVNAWATAHPNEKTILVLATDGDPTGCDGTTNNVNTIATTLVAPELAGNPSILTFVIGVGSSLTSLNQIAASGGTNQAFIVDTAGSDPGGQFLADMQAIEVSSLLGCQYGIPPTPSGVTFDPAKVNVQYTPSGGTPTELGNVPNPAACNATTGCWYYDNPSSPSQIILCDSSCQILSNAGSGAKVDVLLGCATRG